MPDLAVIMSVYKNDKLEYLEQSVQSILTQTYSNFDFLIAFDGPVSNKIEIYFDTVNDKRIKLFKIKEHGGLAKSLNFLLKLISENGKYKFIARMDADDISFQERFSIQRDFLIRNSNVLCVGSWYQEIDESGLVLSNMRLPIFHKEICNFFMKRSALAHPSVMFRQEMIERIGVYPTSTLRLEDYLFWSNAIKKGMLFANIPEYLLKFRRDKNFYKRRSGFRYGLSYIRTRFEINKNLEAPFLIYLYSICVGIIRMMPPSVIRLIYEKLRK